MTLHLCAILAHDQPTFVVAEPIDIGGEEGWITPMGGWRVYPWWSIALEECIAPVSGMSTRRIGLDVIPPPPHDHPDSVWKDGREDAQALHDKEAGRPLLEKIGLLKPAEPLVRRI